MSVRALVDAALVGVRHEPWTPPQIVGTTRVRRILATELDAMIADYQSGMGCVLLSRKYGIAENTALARLKQAGVVVRSVGAVDAEQVYEMASLREDGWTLTAIGERFGLTRQTVAVHLERGSVMTADKRAGL